MNKEEYIEEGINGQWTDWKFEAENYKRVCEGLYKKVDQLEKNRDEFKKWLEEEKNRLARECSNIYEDSLGKHRLVNEDIFDELNKVLSKIQELERGKE